MPAPLDVDWTAIAVQAAAGATHEELAEHWGIPLGTIKARCTREGWKSQARAIQAVKTGTEMTGGGNRTPMHLKASERALTLLQTMGERSKLRAAKVGDKGLRGLQRLQPEQVVEKAGAYKSLVDGLKVIHEWGSEGKSSGSLVNINLLGVPPDSIL